MSTSAEVRDPRRSGAGIDPSIARSFISGFLAERLAAGDALRGPERHELAGAVLLTDVEGFTSHVERLGAQGSAGLERLAAEVNAYFVALVDTVAQFGGDVLAIAGDSFLCLWRADSASALAAAVARAACAAARLLERTADVGAAPLLTRVGLAAGPLSLTLAGGLGDRWELAASGPALAAAARAERHGRAGVVTVSPDAAAYLAGAELRPVAQGLSELVSAPPAPAPEAGSEPAAAAELTGPFVPLPVIAAGGATSQWLAEFRPVTVVMARLPFDGSDLERLHPAVREFQELMAVYEGACKLVVDNKGLTCSGVFGLPPRAHDDDVERGLRSARAVHEALGSLSGPPSVGVASGKVLCGVFGSDARREYSLFGDAINVASRLSALSEGSILIDGRTAHESSLHLQVQSRPDLRVRGRSRPVEVMELAGLQARAGLARPVIDRDEERSVILARMGEVLGSGRSATVLLSGEPGIGKSAVGRQAMRLAEEAGMRRLEVTADAVDRTTPYGPWRAVVAELLGSAATTEALLARLGPEEIDARLLPLLRSVLAGAPAENQTTEGMTGELRRDQVNGLISRAIATATAAQPAALLVEDAQWLDSASWSLVLRVASEVPRVLLIITERRAGSGERAVPERAELLRLPGTVELVIRSLGAEHITALIQQRLGVPSVPRPVLEPILERVAGHPLFCESLVQAMVSSGAIRVGGQEAELVSGTRVDIPSSIESSVLSRVDGLRPGYEMTLKAASVVGRAFTAEEVAVTHPEASEATVSGHLDELCALELIDCQEREDGRSYAFRHQIVRDVAYELLTTAQRQPLHRRLAAHYERAREADGQHSSAALLAHHWLAAGERRQALPHLEQGGRDALREGAFHEAVRLLERAIEVIGDGDDTRRAVLEKELADAQYFLGNLVGGRALLELSLERLGFPLPPTRAAAVRGLLKESAVQGRRLLGRPVVPAVPATPALATAVEAHRVLVQISYLHASSALELCDLTVAALNLGEQLGPSPELARALAHAAALASVLGMRGLAERYGARALEMVGREEHAAAAAYVWNVLAIMQAQRGDWRLALEANQRALELFGELGDYNFEADLWQTRSALMLCRGDTVGATLAWRRTHELAERTGSEVSLCWSLLDQTQTLLAQGETEPAAVALERALAISTPGSDGGTVIERWATTAWTRCRQGRYAEAVAEADAVLTMAARSLATGWVWAEMAAQAVEVLLEVRAAPNSGVSPASLDRTVARGLRVLTRLSFTFRGIRARTHVLRGRAALQRGATEAAVRALARADRAVSGSGGTLDHARIAVARAELSPRSGREELLAGALPILRELGQRAELQRAETLLS